MSAQIPSTMLLSDLLKPTGYDCPEVLTGMTVSEIVEIVEAADDDEDND